jgi:hypothetical protein
MKSKLLVLGGSGLVGSSFINTSKNDTFDDYNWENGKKNNPIFLQPIYLKKLVIALIILSTNSSSIFE